MHKQRHLIGKYSVDKPQHVGEDLVPSDISAQFLKIQAL